MPKLFRCAALLLSLAAGCRAQTATDSPTEIVHTYGFPTVLLYLLSKDVLPMTLRKLKGNGERKYQDFNELDKAGAVTRTDLQNLSKKFDEHTVEDRQAFADIRSEHRESADKISLQLIEIGKGQARIEAILEERQN